MATTTTAVLAKGAAFLVHPGDHARAGFPEDLTAQDREFRDTIRAFLESEVVPIMPSIDEDGGALIPGLLHRLGELGFFLAETHETYGGLDLGVFTALGMIEQLGRAGSFGVAAMVQQGIAMQPIQTYGTEAQKEKWVTRLATADIIGAYALTEPSSGSDALAARTTAVHDPATGDWVLNGTKQFITNAAWASVFTVFAQVDGNKMTAFIVPRGTHGLEVLEEEHKMGIKGSSTCPIRLTNVRVPNDALLGAVGKGHKIALNMLNLGRLKLGATMLGANKFALREAVTYGLERKQFGTPVVRFGLLRRKVADIAAILYGSEAIAYRTAHMIGTLIEETRESLGPVQAKQLAAEEFAIECAIAKIVLTEGATIVADHAVQMLGGYGYTEEFPLARNYRDVRVSRLYEGTNEINRTVIVNTLLRRLGGNTPLATLARAIRERDRGRATGLGAAVDELRTLLADACEATSATVGDGAELRNRQGFVGFLADMASQLCVADAAALRAAKLDHRTDVAPEEKDLSEWIAALAVAKAARAFRDAAEGLFSALMPPDKARERRAELAGLSAFGIDVLALEQKVSDALIASSGEWPDFAPPPC